MLEIVGINQKIKFGGSPELVLVIAADYGRLFELAVTEEQADTILGFYEVHSTEGAPKTKASQVVDSSLLKSEGTRPALSHEFAGAGRI